jgi:DNA-binding transcriptional LysR family regulator
MEMHQIRYFLAAARTLNFTRAAEECNVAQPSLTRAIQQLEEELGGDLFRRERKLSHLTDLGQRMLPLIQQCYDMAQGAKELAGSIKRGEIASLRLALSHTVEISLLVPFLSELNRAFNGLELKFLRGSGIEIAEKLKQGDAELGIAGPLDESWARFDVWPLFTESFSLVVNAGHRLARKLAANLDELNQERLLLRPYCEQGAAAQPQCKFRTYARIIVRARSPVAAQSQHRRRRRSAQRRDPGEPDAPADQRVSPQPHGLSLRGRRTAARRAGDDVHEAAQFGRLDALLELSAHRAAFNAARRSSRSMRLR